MRKVITTKTFDKKFLKLTKNKPELFQDVLSCIKSLSIDTDDKKLRTHKLSGNLKHFYAASVNYSYRIIFKFDKENIYLETIGDHDSVY